MPKTMVYSTTRDAFGSILTYKGPLGYWSKYTRDNSGTELSYENSEGLWKTLATYKEYTLRVRENPLKYWAGCHQFDSVKEALAHWNRSDPRAVLFTKAIIDQRKNDKS